MSAENPHPRVPSGPGDSWGGQDLKRVFAGASAWLARNAEAINSLNVFPVPDGDTGTNMSLTMQSAMKQVADSPSHSAAEIAQGISHGALMGARGNSGVILSQILRGFAEGLAGKAQITAHDFADGWVAATSTAYRAVLKPVEGTILTVIRDLGEGARASAATVNSFNYVLDESCSAARASVARTPQLLDKLRDAGVVDAGGQGLFVLVDGMRRYANGEEIETVQVESVTAAADLLQPGHAHVDHGEYGYCTNFLVSGNWDFDEVRARLATLGDSAVIVGDDHLVKVHIHTETPGTVLNYATLLGSVRQISITNMQDQHEEFLQTYGEEERPLPGLVHSDASNLHVSGRDANTDVAQSKIAVLAVASGAGLIKAFRSMGATAIIEGGQTMNPSTEELLKAIERVPQNEVIVLPNNGNIILTAQQTKGLTKKHVAVVPTETVPQGMAALIALNYDSGLDENARAMQAAASQVVTCEITRAVRDAKVNGISVSEGDIIGLVNNGLVTTGTDRNVVAWDLLGRAGASDRELITIYWGGEVAQHDAEAFYSEVQSRFPNAEVELVNGGQPFYDYIISAE